MRLMVLLLVPLLAGCAASSDEAPGPVTEPIYAGRTVAFDEGGEPMPVENISMDPVNGIVEASGNVHRNCGGLSGYGALMYSNRPMHFKAGTNATGIEATFDWDVANPTLETLFFNFGDVDGQVASVEVAPGETAAIDISRVPLHDRQMNLVIAWPECGSDPVVVRHYEDTVVDVDIVFLP